MRPCLICGTPTTTTRCPQHPNPNRTARSRNSYIATRRRYLDTWRSQHGPWCPGAPDLDHQPHPTPDLTVDHIDGDAWNDHPANWRVLCRPANSSKARRGGGRDDL